MIDLNIPHAVETRKRILAVREAKRQKDLEDFCLRLSNRISEHTREGSEKFGIDYPESFIIENEQTIQGLLREKGYKYSSSNGSIKIDLI